MRQQEAALIQALDRIDEFLAQNAERMSPTLPPSAVQRLAAMREQLTAHGKAQAEHGRVAMRHARRRRELRKTLVQDHMQPLSLMARAELKVSPIPPEFRVPVAQARYSRVLAAGYGLVKVAALHRDALISGGLRPDFLDQLATATDALRGELSAGSQVVAARVEASKLLQEDARQVRRYLRAIDSVVRAAIKPHQALHARWKTLSRIAVAASSAVAREDDGSVTVPGGSAGDVVAG